MVALFFLGELMLSAQCVQDGWGKIYWFKDSPFAKSAAKNKERALLRPKKVKPIKAPVITKRSLKDLMAVTYYCVSCQKHWVSLILKKDHDELVLDDRGMAETQCKKCAKNN